MRRVLWLCSCIIIKPVHQNMLALILMRPSATDNSRWFHVSRYKFIPRFQLCRSFHVSRYKFIPRFQLWCSFHVSRYKFIPQSFLKSINLNTYVRLLGYRAICTRLVASLWHTIKWVSKRVLRGGSLQLLLQLLYADTDTDTGTNYIPHPITSAGSWNPDFWIQLLN